MIRSLISNIDNTVKIYCTSTVHCNEVLMYCTLYSTVLRTVYEENTRNGRVQYTYSTVHMFTINSDWSLHIRLPLLMYSINIIV